VLIGVRGIDGEYGELGEIEVEELYHLSALRAGHGVKGFGAEGNGVLYRGYEIGPVTRTNQELAKVGDGLFPSDASSTNLPGARSSRPSLTVARLVQRNL
jgi:hypothetical protein